MQTPEATWGWQEAREFRIHQHVAGWTHGGARTLPSAAGSPSGSLVPTGHGDRREHAENQMDCSLLITYWAFRISSKTSQTS